MIVTFISLLLPYRNKINSCRTIQNILRCHRRRHMLRRETCCYPQPGHSGEGRPVQPFGFSATMFKVVVAHIRPSEKRVYYDVFSTRHTRGKLKEKRMHGILTTTAAPSYTATYTDDQQQQREEGEKPSKQAATVGQHLPGLATRSSVSCHAAMLSAPIYNAPKGMPFFLGGERS